MEENIMKYYVTLAVDTRINIEVEANNLEEAEVKAQEEFMEVDIGDLNYADSFVVSVEDENGVFVEY